MRSKHLLNDWNISLPVQRILKGLLHFPPKASCIHQRRKYMGWEYPSGLKVFLVPGRLFV